MDRAIQVKARLIVVIILSLGALPAAAQTAAQDLVTARARFGPLVSRGEIGIILNEVAWKHRAEGLGLLVKPNGNNCPQPGTGVRVSCDWLVNLVTHRGGDVLAAATNDDFSPAPGLPQNSKMDEAFDETAFLPPVEPMGGTGGTVPSTPPPPPDLEAARAIADLSRRIDAMAEQLDALARAVANAPDIRDQLSAVTEQLIALKTRPIEFPTYRGRVLGQPFTLTPQK